MSTNKKYKPIILSIVALMIPLALSAQDMASWRTPTKTDLMDDSGWRKEDPDLYLVARADFDSDGREDEASLLINDKENKMGLSVTLSSQGKAKPILVETIEDKNKIIGMGVKVAKPGKYRTACGKGYWACKKGEPATLTLKIPAIDLFQYESANSLFRLGYKS